MAKGNRREHDDAFKPSRKHQATTSSARPTTRLTTKHSVFNAVLLTTELLEHILSQLPMKDLLLAQRVSRKWRDVIGQSKEMQQQLFLLPQQATHTWDFTMVGASQHLRIRRFRGETGHRKLEDYCWTFKSGEINKLVVEPIEDIDLFERADSGANELFYLDPKLLTFDSPDASWRRMLITQPPTFDLCTHFEFKNAGRTCESHNFPNGTTIGDIATLIEDAVADGDELVNWESLVARGFVVMSEEDTEMEVIDEDEWYKKNYPDYV
ncbi:hypothetical protein LTR27_008208 [Elasticomyces elasticus]|nr:hypothetical protein LTR27_008208 [Elasticomyces elasticus]